jgi:oxygen-independent coproporphyrinogen-3 oxidase
MEPVAPELLRRFDVTGPSYASYPTADRFVEAFTAGDQAQVLARRGERSPGTAQPLSLYVDIPFCESLCYFCACNQIVTKQHGRAAAYLKYLAREADLQVALLGAGQPVTQLHLGGGTPTFLTDSELAELMAMLRERFTLVAGGEYAIEIDPRTVDAGRMEAIAKLGFNRISLGVQDFDAGVQKAVHRILPFGHVSSLMAQARVLDFDSVNIDLLYGLPRQTAESFGRTLQQVLQLRPDRVALHAYAHLPDRFKAQRRIVSAELPDAAAKAAILSQSLAALFAAGYSHIGTGHFALAGDSLAVAKRLGRLHRNVQGYTTQAEGDLLGLGMSAIGRMGASYCQNAATLADYCDRIDQGRLPVARGLALTRDDLARRAVIMALMCQGQLVFESIELAWLLDFRSYFAGELEQLKELAAHGLLAMDECGVQMTAQGWYFVRTVAMVFDRHLQADRNRVKFSRIL